MYTALGARRFSSLAQCIDGAATQPGDDSSSSAGRPAPGSQILQSLCPVNLLETQNPCPSLFYSTLNLKVRTDMALSSNCLCSGAGQQVEGQRNGTPAMSASGSKSK